MADRDQATTAQLKVRMKEPLRALLEESARHRGASMNAEIVRRLEESFEPRDPAINTTAIGVAILTAMRKLTESAEPLEIQGHLIRVLEEIFPLPPGKKYDIRFEGERVLPDLIVDKENERRP